MVMVAGASDALDQEEEEGIGEQSRNCLRDEKADNAGAIGDQAAGSGMRLVAGTIDGFSRVGSLTWGLWLMTRETVDRETPASCATSSKVEAIQCSWM